jgi:vacuolar protein sorting-associated protein 26
VKLRYFLRVTIYREYGTNIVKEQDFAVFLPSQLEPESPQNAIKLEVGIEDCLHIEFEYSKSRYHLRDCILGKVHFVLVRIKIKYMELAIIKREVTGNNAQTENETLVKYEVMDGCPHKDEVIPIRLYL